MQKPNEIKARDGDESRTAERGARDAWIGAGAAVVGAIAIVLVLAQTGVGPGSGVERAPATGVNPGAR